MSDRERSPERDRSRDRLRNRPAFDFSGTPHRYDQGQQGTCLILAYGSALGRSLFTTFYGKERYQPQVEKSRKPPARKTPVLITYLSPQCIIEQFGKSSSFIRTLLDYYYMQLLLYIQRSAFESVTELVEISDSGFRNPDVSTLFQGHGDRGVIDLLQEFLSASSEFVTIAPISYDMLLHGEMPNPKRDEYIDDAIIYLQNGFSVVFKLTCDHAVVCTGFDGIKFTCRNQWDNAEFETFYINRADIGKPFYLDGDPCLVRKIVLMKPETDRQDMSSGAAALGNTLHEIRKRAGGKMIDIAHRLAARALVAADRYSPRCYAPLTHTAYSTVLHSGDEKFMVHPVDEIKFPDHIIQTILERVYLFNPQQLHEYEQFIESEGLIPAGKFAAYIQMYKKPPKWDNYMAHRPKMSPEVTQAFMHATKITLSAMMEGEGGYNYEKAKKIRDYLRSMGKPIPDFISIENWNLKALLDWLDENEDDVPLATVIRDTLKSGGKKRRTRKRVAKLRKRTDALVVIHRYLPPARSRRRRSRPWRTRPW